MVGARAAAGADCPANCKEEWSVASINSGASAAVIASGAVPAAGKPAGQRQVAAGQSHPQSLPCP